MPGLRSCSKGASALLPSSIRLAGQVCSEFSPDGNGTIVGVIGRNVADDAHAFLIKGDCAWLQRLVRVAPLDPEAVVTAGPFCCSPSRANLTVHFTSWQTTAADASLHPEA